MYHVLIIIYFDLKTNKLFNYFYSLNWFLCTLKIFLYKMFSETKEKRFLLVLNLFTSNILLMFLEYQVWSVVQCQIINISISVGQLGRVILYLIYASGRVILYLIYASPKPYLCIVRNYRVKKIVFLLSSRLIILYFYD